MEGLISDGTEINLRELSMATSGQGVINRFQLAS
jgi:hypothetical protein